MYSKYYIIRGPDISVLPEPLSKAEDIRTAAIYSILKIYSHGSPYPNPNLIKLEKVLISHILCLCRDIKEVYITNKPGQMIDSYYVTINVGLGTSSCHANSFSELGAQLPCI